MNSEKTNCIDLTEQAYCLLLEGNFYDGLLDGLWTKSGKVDEVPIDKAKKLFNVAQQMYEWFAWFDEEPGAPKYEFWYKNWDEKPSDMKRIGKVIGTLAAKDFSVIEDICNCTDAYYLADPLTYKNPKDFKTNLEKSKPNWEA